MIEVLVCVFLAIVIFTGIFGVYQLGIRVVWLSKTKSVAIALANAQIEKAKNLPYDQVGTKEAVLPYAQGVFESSTTTVKNGLEYTIETQVKYVSDEADGTGSSDACNLDYKRFEVKVLWQGRYPGDVEMTTDIAPKDLVEEANSCAQQPGGLLSVSVFDAYGAMVDSPLIEIFDSLTGELIDSYSPASGEYDFPLATSTYKVVVSKVDYSLSESFGSGDVYNEETIITPEIPNPSVVENSLTEISFSIDKVSSFSVNSFSLWGVGSFSDSFSDEGKVSEKSNVVITDGRVSLATSSEGYLSSGYLFSVDISPSDLISWEELSFSDQEVSGTDLSYQLYYASGTSWFLIPDSDLPENSTGFDSSPVDLSGLSTTTYSQLKIKGNLSTASTSSSPFLDSWQVSWRNSQPTALPSVSFNLRGNKKVGLDSDDQTIYKYNISTSTDSLGHLNIPNLEWDNYTFSSGEPSLGLAATDPSPQPISLAPNTNLSVNLYFQSQNSLLLTCQNAESLEPIFSAQARLYSASLGYDETQYTDEQGQTIFMGMESGAYDLEVSAPGYNSTSSAVFISGDNVKTISLEQVE